MTVFAHNAKKFNRIKFFHNSTNTTEQYNICQDTYYYVEHRNIIATTFRT